MKQANVLGISFVCLTGAALLKAVADSVHRGGKVLVLSGNIHSFNIAYENPAVRQLFVRADYVRIDGEGLRLGARLLGQKLPPRATLADFIWDLAAQCEAHSFSLYLLGAAPGVAERAAARLRERYPALRVVGVMHGFFDRDPESTGNEEVIRRINAARPNVLVVGLGMPAQENWLIANWDRLDVNVTFTGGAVFDYVAGDVRRGPRWMRDHGMEWLARLLLEPRRLARRYVVGNPLFLFRVIKQRLGWNRF